MLSDKEAVERYNFYLQIFGNKRLNAIKNSKNNLWSISNYQEKVQGLEERGFANPQKMITVYPSFFGYSFDNIDEKIKGLKKRGFANPQKMITTFPPILGLSFDNIDNKIKGLEYRGFVKSYEIIATSPATLGLSFTNIDRKLRFCRKMRVDAVEFVNYSIVFIGMSSKLYFPILRKCINDGIEPSPKNVIKIYRLKLY